MGIGKMSISAHKKNNRLNGKFLNTASNATGVDQGFVNQVVLSRGQLV
jgi:hypothetical protein